ncbi:MAG: hypothetical protein JO102_06685 [Elusimicrobia bacterium]|nr:hypothetical protein [Elusimicrobiota bacterium]
MELLRKPLLLGCCLAVAGCAQGNLSGPGALSPGGLSALPSAPRAGMPTSRMKRLSGSNGPQIYVFQGQPDAGTPQVGLVNIGNTLYGTTAAAGANNLGAVYSVTTGGVETVMHSFAGGADGETPYGALTNVNGTLYGTTYQAPPEHGTIFAITPSGSYKVVYTFGTTSGDCIEPNSTMIYLPGKKALYGYAYRGGANGEGCIFKLNLAHKTPKESVVYSFTGSASSSTEASAPVFYNGALYLTTPGGGANGLGAVVKVTFTGQESLVYSFNSEPDGAHPQAGLTVVGSALYGTTSEGGQGACAGSAGCGVIFKLTAAGKEKVLYRFVDDVKVIDGANPQSPLIAVGNTLYGVTANCTGSGCGAGVVFALNTSGKGGDSIVFDFLDTASDPPGYPLFPFGALLNLNGMLYGTTEDSVHIGAGTVYAVPQ